MNICGNKNDPLQFCIEKQPMGSTNPCSVFAWDQFIPAVFRKLLLNFHFRMNRKRPLSEVEIDDIAEHLSDLSSDDVDLFNDDTNDDDFEEPSTCDTASETSDAAIEEGSSSESEGSQEQNDPDQSPKEGNSSGAKYSWTSNVESFAPKMCIPEERRAVILVDLNRGSTISECFFKLFPKSLITQISHYTNLRLQILEKEKKKKIPETSRGEIKIVIGCTLVMCYNRVPAMHMYWSRNKSLQNSAISEAISRDRFMLLMGKLYFNNPEKPPGASKIYQIEEILSCMKHTFLKTRSDSMFQSIDEAMTKFKGRSSLKQYMPLKPIKRGIKLWTRCDACTGYVYDTNIYCGKEAVVNQGTLGERVVLKLAETITSSDVMLAFDRFFTSTILMDTIRFPAVGTYIPGRKNTPSFVGKLANRGDCEMQGCSEGILAMKWKDTKDVLLMTNCHQPTMTVISRKMKDGTLKEVTCPEAIACYNKYMGGVDYADHMIGMYDLDRRSNKWWKKVFYRLLMTAVHNAHVVYEEIIHRKVPFIDFIVELAESLISQGRSECKFNRSRRQGRISKQAKLFENVGDHLPVEKGGRNRCVRCKSRNIEKRTKFICKACQVPLCILCFTPYHT